MNGSNGPRARRASLFFLESLTERNHDRVIKTDRLEVINGIVCFDDGLAPEGNQVVAIQGQAVGL
jgi:hypothetical protein